MRYLFVGGPGRSGTSFVADRLRNHPQVASLKDIELKIFCEKNGLLDLFHVLCESYSPNRAIMAMDQFGRMAEALIAGHYGQPALTTAAPAGEWRGCFGGFAAQLRRDGHPPPLTPAQFLDAARGLLRRIAVLAAAQPGAAKDGGGNRGASQAPDQAPDRVFLEKTPHNLLAIDFLARLAPGGRFLHVMRDPRSIAWSLLAMRWGPDELPAAAAWVDGYCRAWVAAEARAATLGLPLLRLHIEDAAAAPEAAADWLARRLDLTPQPALLAGIDAAVLDRWTAKADAGQRALLDVRLGGWAAHFGYDVARIGRRSCPAFPRPDSEPAAETEPAA